MNYRDDRSQDARSADSTRTAYDAAIANDDVIANAAATHGDARLARSNGTANVNVTRPRHDVAATNDDAVTANDDAAVVVATNDDAARHDCYALTISHGCAVSGRHWKTCLCRWSLAYQRNDCDMPLLWVKRGDYHAERGIYDAVGHLLNLIRARLLALLLLPVLLLPISRQSDSHMPALW